MQADHGQDAGLVRAVFEQDTVGEGGSKMAPDLAPHAPIQARMLARFRDQALNLVIEALRPAPGPIWA